MNIKQNPSIVYLVTPFLLSIITILTYAASLNYPFQFDDSPNILKFFNIRKLTFADLAFTRQRWIITWLDTVLFKIGKFDPFVYRIFNLSVHLLSGIFLLFLIYFCLDNLKKNNFYKNNAYLIALLTSLLFLLHPVQTQTVSYVIQGQLEGLATLFVLAMCLTFVLIAKSTNKFYTKLLTIILILLAIFSTGTKEISIITPLLLILIDWFFIAQGNLQELKKRKILHGSIFAIIFTLYIVYLKPKFFLQLFGLKLTSKNNIGNVITQNAFDKITPITFLISQFQVILHYLLIFIWPFNISVEYDWKLANSFFDLNVIFPLLILLTILAFIYYLLKKNKIDPLAFGLIWFFICIAPRSSIIPCSELLADYKTYLASAGWLFIFAIALAKLYNSLILKFSKKIYFMTAALTILLTCSLSLMTKARNKVWSSSLNFWQNIIDNAPKSRAFNNYGVELTNLGKYKQAVLYFKKAINLDSTSYPDPYINLSSALAILGQFDEAIETLQQALTINPNQPEAYNNLGTFFLYKKRFDEAKACFENALKLLPHYGKAMLNFGRYYLTLKQPQKALTYFQQACSRSDLDQNSECFDMLGQTHLHLRNYDGAIAAFNKVLRLSKNRKQLNDTIFNLGNAYFLKDDYKNAAIIFAQMVQNFPQDSRGWCNLVESHMSLHQFEKVLQIIERAQKIRMTFEGIEIQKAKALASLGYNNLAKNILNEFVASSKNQQLIIIAKQIATKIN